MPASILYVPHGGGPLPLLGDPGHADMVAFLQSMAAALPEPDAIVVISAHWETEQVSVMTAASPELVYDYSGFPPESYSLRYPAPGAPELAVQCAGWLRQRGFQAREVPGRGLDHGVFVPLRIMYPDAGIPVTQVSLLASLDAQAHLDLGAALAPLRRRNVLVLGSGMSYHNLGVMLGRRPSQPTDADRQFDEWLGHACCSDQIDGEGRLARLAQWQQAPAARACHPREEHLLPLHVCAGLAAGEAATRVYSAPLMGRRVSAFLWQ